MNGVWERVHRDVFRIAGTHSTWRQDLIIASLIWGRGATISHRGAARLWRLASFERIVVELTVPKQRRRRSAPGIVHRGSLRSFEVTVVDAIPVTTPARTLIDLAAVAEIDAVEEALDDAIGRGLVSIPSVRRRLDALARKGRPGIAAMRALLEARDGSLSVPMSVFETRLLRELKRARIPPPACQYEVRHEGNHIATVDFAWPERRLAIEADGFKWHSARTRFERDRGRRNAMTLVGWRVIHVTWTGLSGQPDRVIADVRKALTA
jgi:very-short-patch-repair endonuclease